MTQVPTGKVKAHQVIANRMPPRAARTHHGRGRGQPQQGEAHHRHAVEHGEAAQRGARTAPRPRGRRVGEPPAAVVDWPSGPEDQEQGRGQRERQRPAATAGRRPAAASPASPAGSGRTSRSSRAAAPRCRLTRRADAAPAADRARRTPWATTGSSHTGAAAASGAASTMRYGTATAATSPTTRPRGEQRRVHGDRGLVADQSRPTTRRRRRRPAAPSARQP